MMLFSLKDLEPIFHIDLRKGDVVFFRRSDGRYVGPMLIVSGVTKSMSPPMWIGLGADLSSSGDGPWSELDEVPKDADLFYSRGNRNVLDDANLLLRLAPDTIDALKKAK